MTAPYVRGVGEEMGFGREQQSSEKECLKPVKGLFFCSYLNIHSSNGCWEIYFQLYLHSLQLQTNEEFLFVDLLFK